MIIGETTVAFPLVFISKETSCKASADQRSSAPHRLHPSAKRGATRQSCITSPGIPSPNDNPFVCLPNINLSRPRASSVNHQQGPRVMTRVHHVCPALFHRITVPPLYLPCGVPSPPPPAALVSNSFGAGSVSVRVGATECTIGRATNRFLKPG